MEEPIKKKPALMPENAERVFRGKIFDIWQWEQKLYDGSIGTFERVSRPNTANVIVVKDGKVLVQKQEQPDKAQVYYSLPGGRCDNGPDEDPLTAAKRELLEETGLVSNDWTLWKEDAPFNKIIWTIYTFLARDCRKEAEPRLDAGERIENLWVDFDEFLKLGKEALFYDRETLVAVGRMKADKEEKERFRKLILGE